MAQQLDVAARVERRIDGLARQRVETFVAEVPVYRRLPQEQLDGEISTSAARTCGCSSAACASSAPRLRRS